MQPISVIAPYLPIPLHAKRDVARAKIGAMFADIIQKRRASGAKEKDILQTFIDGKYERVNGGRALTDSEITGLLVAALFAGMHTSTITSSWTGLFLTTNPAAWDACVAEQRDVIKRFGPEVRRGLGRCRAGGRRVERGQVGCCAENRLRCCVCLRDSPAGSTEQVGCVCAAPPHARLTLAPRR